MQNLRSRTAGLSRRCKRSAAGQCSTAPCAATRHALLVTRNRRPLSRTEFALVIAVATFLGSKGSSDANAPGSPCIPPRAACDRGDAAHLPCTRGDGVKSPCIFIEDIAMSRTNRNVTCVVDDACDRRISII